MTTIAADPPASAWLDKRLEEIKTLAPKKSAQAQDLAKLDRVLAAMRRK